MDSASDLESRIHISSPFSYYHRGSSEATAEQCVSDPGRMHACVCAGTSFVRAYLCVHLCVNVCVPALCVGLCIRSDSFRFASCTVTQSSTLLFLKKGLAYFLFTISGGSKLLM